MTNVVGYARVSRHDQNPAAQEAELLDAGAVRVFVDQGESSRVKDRPQWLACLDYLRAGDTLLERVARTREGRRGDLALRPTAFASGTRRGRWCSSSASRVPTNYQ